MSPLNEAVIARIRGEMERQGVSERHLARLMAMPRMWVRRRLSLGEVGFGITDVERVASALGVPVSQLLGDNEPAVTPGGGTQ